MSRSDGNPEVTALLQAWRSGNEAALAKLMPLVYRELKKIARHLLRDLHGHDTLQSTALVHEAYLRLQGLDRLGWEDRAHFFAMCARLMRRVLVDHARYLARDKRGGGGHKVTLTDLEATTAEPTLSPLRLDEALRELKRYDAQRAEIVELRFFGGLNRDEIAEVLGISSATVTRRWRTARAWLSDYLS